VDWEEKGAGGSVHINSLSSSLKVKIVKIILSRINHVAASNQTKEGLPHVPISPPFLEKHEQQHSSQQPSVVECIQSASQANGKSLSISAKISHTSFTKHVSATLSVSSNQNC